MLIDKRWLYLTPTHDYAVLIYPRVALSPSTPAGQSEEACRHGAGCSCDFHQVSGSGRSISGKIHDGRCQDLLFPLLKFDMFRLMPLVVIRVHRCWWHLFRSSRRQQRTMSPSSILISSSCCVTLPTITVLLPASLPPGSAHLHLSPVFATNPLPDRRGERSVIVFAFKARRFIKTAWISLAHDKETFFQCNKTRFRVRVRWHCAAVTLNMKTIRFLFIKELKSKSHYQFGSFILNVLLRLPTEENIDSLIFCVLILNQYLKADYQFLM
ncbi:uncharacterized protein [Nothobranchius furzeri]|uniref:uncharacterized protein isoform X2 n=1 Tax=Nothobranchius furzeri TaxID=105023 RepID=UPI002403FBB5|nr:uncharacterized protein LOC129163981 [Nothobranchius furzeri]